MRVLVDECLPRHLRQWLSTARPDWTVMTVQDAGWASMKNGLEPNNQRAEHIAKANEIHAHPLVDALACTSGSLSWLALRDR